MSDEATRLIYRSVLPASFAFPRLRLAGPFPGLALLGPGSAAEHSTLISIDQPKSGTQRGLKQLGHVNQVGMQPSKNFQTFRQRCTVSRCARIASLKMDSRIWCRSWRYSRAGCPSMPASADITENS